MKKRLCSMVVILILIMTIIPANCVFAKKALKLNKSKVTMSVGDSVKLKVKNTKRSIKWKSSNKKVASVNKKGKVVAKKAGKTTITAKVKKKKLKCSVIVKQKANNAQSIPKPTNATIPETTKEVEIPTTSNQEQETTTEEQEEGYSGVSGKVYNKSGELIKNVQLKLYLSSEYEDKGYDGNYEELYINENGKYYINVEYNVPYSIIYGDYDEVHCEVGRITFNKNDNNKNMTLDLIKVKGKITMNGNTFNGYKDIYACDSSYDMHMYFCSLYNDESEYELYLTRKKKEYGLVIRSNGWEGSINYEKLNIPDDTDVINHDIDVNVKTIKANEIYELDLDQPYNTYNVEISESGVYCLQGINKSNVLFECSYQNANSSSSFDDCYIESNDWSDSNLQTYVLVENRKCTLHFRSNSNHDKVKIRLVKSNETVNKLELNQMKKWDFDEDNRIKYFSFKAEETGYYYINGTTSDKDNENYMWIDFTAPDNKEIYHNENGTLVKTWEDGLLINKGETAMVEIYCNGSTMSVSFEINKR